MISFDDLVNSGGDTEQLENEMREIRLNTQINRFSIIDCTNSIESLSSMMSTITVADYSASLSSLSSDTLALYNSLTTITGGGGGGFGYLEPYSAHSTESFIYNCNDVLSNQAFPSFETFKEVGPNINFDNVSFTTNQKLNLKGQTINSCLIQSNSKPMMLDYKLIQNNNIYDNSLMNVKADEFKNNVLTNNNFINISNFTNTGNIYSSNQFLNITGNEINANTFSVNTILNMNCYNVESNSMPSNYLFNANAYSVNSNYCWGRVLENVNGFSMCNNSFYGYVGQLKYFEASKNTFKPTILDLTGISGTSNSITARIGHIKFFKSSENSYGGVDWGGILNYEGITAMKDDFHRINGYGYLKIGYLYSCSLSYFTKCYLSAALATSCQFNDIYDCSIDVWSSYRSNTITSCNLIKLNGLSAGFGYNKFDSISTLKLNIYTDYGDTYSRITELHLRDANVFLSSRNNSFDNIGKYIFKYTDGLYSGTDIISDLTSISNKAFIKYVPCSWLNQTYTSSGGSGGFDYWEGYVSHRQNGYNVSGTVKSALIVDNIYSLSPYANFSYCTFQSLYEVHSLNCEYFHTNSFFSNQTEINIKASEFLENTFMNCKMVNVSACTFTGNYYIANDVVNVSAHNMKYSNTFNNNDIVNITCYNTDYINLNKPIISGNNYVNIMADNLWSGVMNDNKFVNVNCKTIKYFNISNTFNNITAYYIGNNTIVNNNANINCLFNFSCSNFNDNSVQVRTNSFNLSALYMADNTFSNCSYLTINAGNISRLQLYSDSQAISTNRILKLKGNSIDSCNIMDYERVYLDCPIMKNIHLNGCSSIYLTTTYDFLKSWVYSSDYSNFNYSDKVIYGDRCSHFDFNDIDLVLDRFGGYSLTQIDKSKCYINGIPLIKLYPDA